MLLVGGIGGILLLVTAATAAVDGLSGSAPMTTVRRPGRLALVGGLALSLGLAGIAAAWARLPVQAPIDRRDPDPLLALRAGSARSCRPACRVTIVLRNDDPIDHEWIVGDAAIHERHRTGTEPVHGTRPTEVTIPAGSSRETTVTFDTPGTYLYICHLPGHEAYGMVGTLVVTGD